MTDTCHVGEWRADAPAWCSSGLCDDSELLEAVRAGSTPAVWDLFGRHGGVVYALARLLTSSDEDAQQVVEDVFVNLQRSGGRLKDPVDNVCLALLAMARRRCLAVGGPSNDVAFSEDQQARALMLLGDASLADVVQIFAADRRVYR